MTQVLESGGRCLANVARHTNATSVELRLEPGRLTIPHFPASRS